MRKQATIPTPAASADTQALIDFMRERDRLKSRNKGGIAFMVICFLIPPFQLLLPIAIWVMLKRDRELKRFERGKR